MLYGLFGGAFDPVHNGHLHLAQAFTRCLKLERVCFIPLHTPVHRPEPAANATHRHAMLRAALAPHPGMCIDEIELRRPSPSRTVETLVALRKRLRRERHLCLLMGSDAFCGFTSWYRWEEILRLVHIAVACRAGALPDWADGQWPGPIQELLHQRGTAESRVLRRVPAGHILCRDIRAPEVSSSQVRALLAAGKEPAHLIPPSVFSYIRLHGLYR